MNSAGKFIAFALTFVFCFNSHSEIILADGIDNVRKIFIKIVSEYKIDSGRNLTVKQESKFLKNNNLSSFDELTEELTFEMVRKQLSGTKKGVCRTFAHYLHHFFLENDVKSIILLILDQKGESHCANLYFDEAKNKACVADATKAAGFNFEFPAVFYNTSIYDYLAHYLKTPGKYSFFVTTKYSEIDLTKYAVNLKEFLENSWGIALVF